MNMRNGQRPSAAILRPPCAHSPQSLPRSGCLSQLRIRFFVCFPARRREFILSDAAQNQISRARYVNVIMFVAFGLHFACIALSQGLNIKEIGC